MGGGTLARPPSAVYPLFAIIGFAAGGALWYLGRLATRPEVIWNRAGNPTPYQTVQQNQTTKMYNPTGHFESSWTRKGF
ncbi:hypothetical protein HDV00_011140 [Rhizophlyctis rosea]|nr:hypothetical protein HDV00_011140 [Rhizophlyctis rosea]